MQLAEHVVRSLILEDDFEQSRVIVFGLPQTKTGLTAFTTRQLIQRLILLRYVRNPEEALKKFTFLQKDNQRAVVMYGKLSRLTKEQFEQAREWLNFDKESVFRIQGLHEPVELSQLLDRDSVEDNDIVKNASFVGIGIHKSAKPPTVIHVEPGSPAHKAGIREDHKIVRIGKEDTLTPDDFLRAVHRLKADKEVIFIVRHQGELYHAVIVPISLNEADLPRLDQPQAPKEKSWDELEKEIEALPEAPPKATEPPVNPAPATPGMREWLWNQLKSGAEVPATILKEETARLLRNLIRHGAIRSADALYDWIQRRKQEQEMEPEREQKREPSRYSPQDPWSPETD